MLLHSLDTLFVGRNFINLPSLHSTNAYALSLLSKSKPSEGTVISTPDQYAGRGQIGRTWESEPHKNIALSVILYPTFLAANQQFLLNQSISLAVFDLLEAHFPRRVHIKWPNDMYIDGRKAVGMLIQNAISGSFLRSSVIGIGINVNQTSFSPELPNATSMKMLAGEEMDLSKLMVQLFHNIENRYLKLKSGNLVPLQEAYLENLYRYQEEHLFQRPNGDTFKGTITGLSDIGALKVYNGGKEEFFGLKEIKFL